MSYHAPRKKSYFQLALRELSVPGWKVNFSYTLSLLLFLLRKVHCFCTDVIISPPLFKEHLQLHGWFYVTNWCLVCLFGCCYGRGVKAEMTQL